jgi:Siphovirus Gp157
MAAIVAPVVPIRPQSLFDLTERLTELLDSIDMCEDADVRAECEQEIADVLSRQLSKVDNMAEFSDHLEFQIALRKKQVQLLEKANRRAAGILERIDNAILRTMDATGRKSLEGSLYSFSLRKLPPSVEVTNQAVVPAQYIRTTVSESVDKQVAKVDLKNGVTIPGLSYVSDRKGVVRR